MYCSEHHAKKRFEVLIFVYLRPTISIPTFISFTGKIHTLPIFLHHLCCCRSIHPPRNADCWKTVGRYASSRELYHKYYIILKSSPNGRSSITTCSTRYLSKITPWGKFIGRSLLDRTMFPHTIVVPKIEFTLYRNIHTKHSPPDDFENR